MSASRIVPHDAPAGQRRRNHGAMMVFGRDLEYAFSKTRPLGALMAFYAFYVIAIVILILHFTGWLKRNNLEWLILVLAGAVFPVVVFLR
jgi:hypothetical protein